jgi:hypothetical protein
MSIGSVALKFWRKFWRWVTLTLARTVVAGALALVVVAGIAVAVTAAVRLSDQCGPGVSYHGPDRECIGVTDGSVSFGGELSPVEHAILREDQNLGATYVTIALLLPMTAPDVPTQGEILHEVQGAYAAQYRANHLDDGAVPPIRLVLANPGLNSAQWPYVVRELEAMTGPPDNLRAVVGIGISTGQTKAEVRALTAHHVPVVGGSISADDIANPTVGAQPFPGLARISPTNLQVATALTHLSGVNPRQAVLVEDNRQGDDYITSLAQVFGRNAAQFPVQPYLFTSPPNESQVGDTANRFLDYIVPSICLTGAKWIYFAGRQVQLRAFINALAGRPCKRNFTVITGSAASHLATDSNLDRAAFSHGVALEYAAIASPDAWSRADDPSTVGSRADWQHFITALGDAARKDPIGPTSLTDGETIINYDAAWTAMVAIRQNAQSTEVPAVSEVADAWSGLNGQNMVGGASGWICLDNSGNPYDKAIPIVRFTVRGPEFVAVAWPAGRPPSPDCQIPPGG